MPQAQTTESHAKMAVNSAIYKYAVIALAGGLYKFRSEVSGEAVDVLQREFFSKEKDIDLLPLLKESINDEAPSLHYVNRIKSFFPEDEQLYSRVIYGLFRMLLTNGTLQPEELKMMRDITLEFGLPDSFYLHCVRGVMMSNSSDPYRIMGVAKNVDRHYLKAEYRRQMAAYHPDKFMGEDWANDVRVIANARNNQVADAYQAIRQQKKWP